MGIVARCASLVTATRLFADPGLCPPDKKAMLLVYLLTRSYNRPDCNFKKRDLSLCGGYQSMQALGCQLERARRGESEAMSMLYRQFLPGVFGYIAARVPDRAIAEDLTSEVFLKMVEGISRLRASDEAGFAAWILQIARVTVATYYRKSEKQLTCIPLEPTSWEEEEGKESWEIPADHPDADPVRQAEAREE